MGLGLRVPGFVYTEGLGSFSCSLRLHVLEREHFLFGAVPVTQPHILP